MSFPWPSRPTGIVRSTVAYVISLSPSQTHAHIYSVRHGHTRITSNTIKVTNLWVTRAVVDPFRVASSYRSRTIAGDETRAKLHRQRSKLLPLLWSCRILSRLDPPAHKLNALFISTHTATAMCLSTDPPSYLSRRFWCRDDPIPPDTHNRARA